MCWKSFFLGAAVGIGAFKATKYIKRVFQQPESPSPQSIPVAVLLQESEDETTFFATEDYYETPSVVEPVSTEDLTCLQTVAGFFRHGAQKAKQVVQNIISFPGVVVNFVNQFTEAVARCAEGDSDYDRLFMKYKRVLLRLEDMTSERDTALERLAELLSVLGIAY